MHGLINRALQGFLVDMHGAPLWAEIASQANLPFDSFETMLSYDHSLTHDVFEAACAVLHRDPNSLLEDMGTYLVTQDTLEPLRRLLRFGGATFHDFLYSLDELADRGKLAMPDIEMPRLSLEQGDMAGSFRLRRNGTCRGLRRFFWAACAPWPMITGRLFCCLWTGPRRARNICGLIWSIPNLRKAEASI